MKKLLTISVDEELLFNLENLKDLYNSKSEVVLSKSAFCQLLLKYGVQRVSNSIIEDEEYANL